jgi:zinc-ribbon domain
MATCTQCGTTLLDTAGFCSQCGAVRNAVAPAAAPPQPAASAPFRGAKTMIGGVVDPAAIREAPAPVAPVAPVPAPAAPLGSRPANANANANANAKTMLGMSASDFLPPGLAAPPSSPAAARFDGQPRQENRTMLGVAMPGIAPTHGGQAAPAPQPRDNQTMLGVAMPGIAPTHESGRPPENAPRAAVPVRPKPLAALPPIVPAPAPLALEAMPRAPVIVANKGFPLAAVAGGIGTLVLVAGVAVFFLWKGGTTLLVSPRLGPTGREQLHLVCEACKDGTSASLEGAKATFTNKQADLDLKTPLKVGDNPFTIEINRAGTGRDEAIKAIVPVAYRVRADLADIASDPPVITVRVEALPGTDVRVDGKPVALDVHGAGAFAIDISSETDGPSDEGKVIEKTIPYEVVPKNGKSEKGTVAARVGVIPLRVDAPGSHAVTESARFWVAGRTSKGGIVSLNGRPVAVAPNGAFGDAIDAPAPGESVIVVRATAPQVAPRTVHLAVKRVQHLEPEAKAFEAAHPASSSLGYDAIIGNIAASAGQEIVVEGDVLESRVQNHQTVIIVDDRRGCAKGPCVARVVHGEDTALKPGETIRAYGRITRAVSTSDGKSVPEVEADFLVRGKTHP